MNQHPKCSREPINDHGPQPYAVRIDKAAEQNQNYRAALWTGCNLQLTLMCIPAGGEIGLEVHPDTDQFLRVESGSGQVLMGPTKDCLQYRSPVCGGYAVFVPAGTWHNMKNTGNCPLKIYTVYAPPHHPHGTVQATKPKADAQED